MAGKTRLGRRAFLGATAVGVASLAGCAGFDPLESAPSYDASALETLSEETPPSIPRSIPVDIPADLQQGFQAEAQDLLASVPQQPALPNERVAADLAEDRQRVSDSLGSDDDAHTPLQQLGSARYTLSKAAEIDGAYRAATGDIELADVRADRGRLRSQLYDFLQSWEYRGPGPLEAVVVHRNVENVLSETKQAIRPDRALPAEPTTAPFTVGEVVGGIKRGFAALETAKVLRTTYLEGLESPTAYRESIISRSRVIDSWNREFRYRLQDYFEENERPDVTDAEHPAEFLYREASVSNRRIQRSIERTREREQFAQAVIQGGYMVATYRSARQAIETVRNEELPPPEAASDVRIEYEQAVAALEAALEASPEPIAPAISWPALDHLEDGLRRLGETQRYPRAVYMATAQFRLARLYAEAVPDAAKTVESWFPE